jgi:prephenate dehydrogenase
LKQLQEATVAVVGLGLMGGSLAAALRARGSVRRVVGIARRVETVVEASARGFIDEGTCDPVAGVSDADVVIFGTPVQTTLALLNSLGPFLRSGSIVSDMGSTKVAVLEAMSKMPLEMQPIGGHPMCGKETAGLSAADADLFLDKIYVLTPLERTPPEALLTMQALAEAVGARSLVLDPARHDRLVAAISHLPYILAACLVAAADDMATEDPLVWELAASGFRDTSRLAASDTTMMRDILLTNEENVLYLIDLFGRRLTQMSADLAQRDTERLVDLMSRVRQRREGLFR